MVMVKAEKRLNRKFTVEEIEDGTMGALLEESDFDIERTVSTHFYQTLHVSLPYFDSFRLAH